MSIRIIATGGHSGLGLEALKTLLATPALASGGSLTLMVRDANAPAVVKARRMLSEQHKAATSSTDSRLTVDTHNMDLASLSSVRKAAEAIRPQLQVSAASASGQDIFLLNAAVAKATRNTVVDADRVTESVEYNSDHLVSTDSCIETTACVNHVAHLLFISSLAPIISANAKLGRRTRIVFTGSALHRSIKDVAVLDRFFSAASHESTSPWTLRETYAASKFLQMLGVRALRQRLQDALEAAKAPAGSVEIVVVQPGFVPQTGLCRDSGLLTRLAMSYVLPWAPFATSLDDAGRYIADACTIDLSESEAQEEEQDGFLSRDSLVPSALLEVRAKKQRFGTLDSRTADTQLQEKWWPAACGQV
ncbi:Short-chain dehydrogenase [Pseudozyma hubeiensis]|nr:Short-chain dehydrogenase [Pseudozyma hubeiensis]